MVCALRTKYRLMAIKPVMDRMKTGTNHAGKLSLYFVKSYAALSERSPAERNSVKRSAFRIVSLRRGLTFDNVPFIISPFGSGMRRTMQLQIYELRITSYNP
jgi:hypothetical protein